MSNLKRERHLMLRRDMLAAMRKAVSLVKELERQIEALEGAAIDE